MRTITEMARENGAKGRTNQFLDNLRSEIARSGGYGTLFDPKREERIERARAAAQSARLRASWAHVEAAVLGHHPGRRLVFSGEKCPGAPSSPNVSQMSAVGPDGLRCAAEADLGERIVHQFALDPGSAPRGVAQPTRTERRKDEMSSTAPLGCA
jgi:hypothetical protein